jgi:3-oxoadipate enol-lactonase
MPIAKLHDVEIYYESEGEGQPILFIGGLGAGQPLWAPVVEHLKSQYRCLTFDNRGIGQSSKPPTGYTIPDLTQDALGLIEYLSISRPHVVGMSLGGLIAQNMALQRPEAVASLILVGSFAKTSPRGDVVQQTRKFLQRSLQPYEYFLVQATWMFGAKTLARPGFAENYARKAADNPHPQAKHAFDQLAEGVSKFDTREQLKNIRQPTLVLVGEDDIMAVPAQSRVLAQGIPGAEMEVIPEMGHFCLVTVAAKDLAGRVDSFIKRIDGRSASRSV